MSWQPSVSVCRQDVVEQTLITPQEATGRDEDGGHRRSCPPMAPRTAGSPLQRHLSINCCKPPNGMFWQSSICLTIGMEATALSPMFQSVFSGGYGNKKSSAPCIYSCSDSDTQNINEYVKIGENRMLYYALMRIEYVKMCEYIFLHAPLCRYMTAFEYWSKRVYVECMYGSSLGVL